MPKAQETILEIDLKALKHNFEYLKSKLKSNTKFLAVVKAFAYGNEANEIAGYLQNLDVDYFAVAYTSEGIALRDAGITKPILVLHPLPISFKLLIERCLEPSLYNEKVLNEFIEVAKTEKQTNYPIHLKFNTGLNRLGFSENDIVAIHSKLSKSSAVKIKSIFSHLAASEDLNEDNYKKGQILFLTFTYQCPLGFHLTPYYKKNAELKNTIKKRILKLKGFKWNHKKTNEDFSKIRKYLNNGKYTKKNPFILNSHCGVYETTKLDRPHYHALIDLTYKKKLHSHYWTNNIIHLKKIQYHWNTIT